MRTPKRHPHYDALSTYPVKHLTYDGLISMAAIETAIKHNADKLSGVMMDFACGTRPYEAYFSHVDSYVGVDIEVSGRDAAMKKADVFYDGQTLPFEDGHFDSVLCTQAFEHIVNIDHVIGEIARVHKQGGMFLLTLPLCYEEHEIPYDFYRYTTYGITALLEKHGYSVLSVQKDTSFKDTLRALKIRCYISRYDHVRCNKWFRFHVKCLEFGQKLVCLYHNLGYLLFPKAQEDKLALNLIVVAQRQ